MNLNRRRPAQQTIKKHRILLPVVFAAAPAVAFYAILFRTAQNIPTYDNYVGTLEFTNHLVTINGFLTKTSFLLTNQFNEYKLPFSEALVWLQYSLVGRIDFRLLSAVSNGFVLLLALLLWLMFLPAREDTGSRLALFIPVSYLLFQFEYQEILNWGGAGLQHIPSVVFAFAAIYLLFLRTLAGFCGALVCFVLAIASSGNGFILFPIGLLPLVTNRSYKRIAVWSLEFLGCVAGYLYHYDWMSSRSSPDHSISSALLRLRPAYVLSFIGSAASIPFHMASFALGASLCVFFGWMVGRGYIRKNPTVCCCVLFLILTAIGVAGIRSDLGMTASMASRYTFFSALFLIFAWIAIVEEFLQHDSSPLLMNGAYLTGVAVAFSFCLFMDAAGFILIRICNEKLVEGMTYFEHPTNLYPNRGPVIAYWEGDLRASLNPRARAALLESIRLGVYKPPEL